MSTYPALSLGMLVPAQAAKVFTKAVDCSCYRTLSREPPGVDSCVLPAEQQLTALLQGSPVV